MAKNYLPVLTLQKGYRFVVFWAFRILSAILARPGLTAVFFVMLFLDASVYFTFRNNPDPSYLPRGDTPCYTLPAVSIYSGKGFCMLDGNSVQPPLDIWTAGVPMNKLVPVAKAMTPIPTNDREPFYSMLMALALRMLGPELSSVSRFNALFLFPLNNLFVLLLAWKLSRNWLIPLLAIYLNTILNGPSVVQLTAPVLPVNTLLLGAAWFFNMALEKRTLKWPYAVTGCFIGLAAFTRFLYFFTWPILALVIIIRNYRRPRHAAVALLLFLVPVFSINGSWYVRNHIRFGEWSHTTRGGLNLLLRTADNGRPAGFPGEKSWAETELAIKIPDARWNNISKDKYFGKIALKRMRQYPINYLSFAPVAATSLWNADYLNDLGRFSFGLGSVDRILDSLFITKLTSTWGNSLVRKLYPFFFVGCAFLIVLAVRRKQILPMILLFFPLYQTAAHSYLTNVYNWWFLAYAWPFIYIIAATGLGFLIQAAAHFISNPSSLESVSVHPPSGNRWDN